MPSGDPERRSAVPDDEHSVTSADRSMADGGTSYTPLFDAFPDPLLAYADVEDSPVVRAVNPAFEAAFDVDPDGATDETLVAYLLAETVESVPGGTRAEPPGPPTVPADDILGRIRSAPGTTVLVRSRSDGEMRRFRLQNVPVADREDYLVFTDVTDLAPA